MTDWGYKTEWSVSFDLPVDEKMKEYWMFTLFHSNAVGENALFDRFPSREDLLRVCGGEEYLIIHTMQLTEEQYYKLGGKKFAEEQL